MDISGKEIILREKELAVHLTETFITYWSTRTNSNALQSKDVIDFLEKAHTCLSHLGEK